ncbi:MAG: excinuclease ABC subunit UvrC [Bacteroidota bacterium]
MKRHLFTCQTRNKLPKGPGVYHFYNKKQEIIYVGKANNIRNRVASYFRGELDLKTRTLASQIFYVSCVIVESESDSLLLENNLIKHYQPRFNILLRDGKTYPYLCITNEPYPRLIVTRQRQPSLGTYFGPFTDIKSLQMVRELIRELYPLRTCKLNLSAKNIAKGNFRVCLEYHIGKCLGPCEGKQREEGYLQDIEAVTQLLKGNFQAVKKDLKKKMLAAAERHDFQEAQHFKERIEALDRYQARSIIAHPRWGILDVIAIVSDQTHAYISYLHIYQGNMRFVDTIAIEKKLAEDDRDLAALLLVHFRDQVESKAKTILSNVAIRPLPKDTTLTIPQLGDKKKLVDMALHNAWFFKKEQINKKVTQKRAPRTPLIHLQQDLRLKEIPMHIECFDNSNLQGTHPVSAMVCFKEGRPAKKHYRHFHVKTVEGIDDFATMQEVVYRRYHRLAEEKAPFPDLIVIDGGKGQLSAAVEALKKAGVYEKTAIIAIAKRLEEIYYPNDPLPLHLNKRSPSLQLLQKIRNEAHRFAVTFHRKTRNRHTFKTKLEEIPGIGKKTIDTLLQTFGGMSQIQKASLETLADAVGRHKAQKVYQALHL